MKLDSWGRPGLTLCELWTLLTICECGIVTTQEAFPHHREHCPGEPMESGSDEESEEDISEVDSILDSESD